MSPSIHERSNFYGKYFYPVLVKQKKKKDNVLILCEDDELFFYPLTPMEDENGTAVFQSAIWVSKDPKIVGDF